VVHSEDGADIAGILTERDYLYKVILDNRDSTKTLGTLSFL
jgi:hypothetical protein